MSRRLLFSGVVWTLVLACAWPVCAQEKYPVRPVTVIVPMNPGGGTDLVGRAFAEALKKQLDQSFAVENVPGAGSAIGTTKLHGAKPDGYTLLMALSSISIIPEADKLFGRPPTFTVDQFVPLALLSADPTILVVRSDLPWKTAKEFIDSYFARHSGARQFLDNCVIEAEEKGYVTTILGRRLPIPDIASKNGNVRAFAQRNAVNYPIQGSAADIIKKAMVRVFEEMRKGGLKSRLIMQVHDELVFEVPEEEKTDMELLVRREMEHALSLRVPLKAQHLL